MVDAVIRGNPGNGQRIDALKATHVVAVLLWIGAALVVGVDATARTEIVLGRVRIELVERQVFRALDDVDATQRHRGNHRAFAPANRTIAAPWINDAIRQVKLQFHRTAMTSGAMPGLDDDAVNFLEHWQEFRRCIRNWGPSVR